MIISPERLLQADPIDYADLVLRIGDPGTRREDRVHLGVLATGCELELSMDGTATVTVNMAEQERGQLAEMFSPVFKPDASSRPRLTGWNTITLLGSTYVLEEISRTGVGTWEVVFYDQVSELMKKAHGALKVSRGQKTRPEFVGMMAREAGVPAWIPQAHDKSLIHSFAPSDLNTLRQANGSKVTGLSGSVTPVQFAQALLRYMGMEPTHARVQVIAGWSKAENRFEWRNPLCTTRIIHHGEISMNSAGVKKYRTWDDGIRATAETLKLAAYAGILRGLRKNSVQQVLASAQEFNTWGTGAALASSAIRNGPKHAGTGNATHGDKNISSTDNGTVDRAFVERFEFTRGKRENSWDAAKRLADEVRWARFAVFNTLVFANELALASDPSPYEFVETDSWVDQALWTCTQRERIDEMQITGRLAAVLPPGAAVAVKDDGLPTFGTWLVRDFKRDLLDTDCKVDVTLARPRAPLAEPASTVKTVSGQTATGSTLRDRIIAEAKKTLTVKDSDGNGGTGYRYYWQGGATTENPLPPPNHAYRSDCSQWVRAIYLKAGAPDPGVDTGAQQAKGKLTSHPKPGDLLLMPDHVELYVGNGKTIGHGDALINYGEASYYIANRGARYYTFGFLD